MELEQEKEARPRLLQEGVQLFQAEQSAAPKGQQGSIPDTTEGGYFNLHPGQFLLKPFQNHYKTSSWLICSNNMVTSLQEA